MGSCGVAWCMAIAAVAFEIWLWCLVKSAKRSLGLYMYT